MMYAQRSLAYNSSDVDWHDQEWKKMITKNMSTLHKEQWYVAHRHNLGNQDYLQYWVVGIATTLSVIAFTNFFLYLIGATDIMGWTWINLLVAVIYFILVLAMLKKIPHFHDTFFVHREFEIMCYASGISVAAIAILGTAQTLFGSNLAIDTVGFVILIYKSFIIPFISSFWVLRQMDSSVATPRSTDSRSDAGLAFDTQNTLQVTKEFTAITKSDSGSMSNLAIVKRRESFKIPDNLKDLLKNETYLNRFAQHLVEELSTECLLVIFLYSLPLDSSH